VNKEEASFWAGVVMATYKDLFPNKIVLHGSTNHDLVYGLSKFVSGRARYQQATGGGPRAITKWVITGIDPKKIDEIARAINSLSPSVNPLRFL